MGLGHALKVSASAISGTLGWMGRASFLLDEWMRSAEPDRSVRIFWRADAEMLTETTMAGGCRPCRLPFE
jgi:hypothetical protein